MVDSSGHVDILFTSSAIFHIFLVKRHEHYDARGDQREERQKRKLLSLTFNPDHVEHADCQPEHSYDQKSDDYRRFVHSFNDWFNPGPADPRDCLG